MLMPAISQLRAEPTRNGSTFVGMTKQWLAHQDRRVACEAALQASSNLHPALQKEFNLEVDTLMTKQYELIAAVVQTPATVVDAIADKLEFLRMIAVSEVESLRAMDQTRLDLFRSLKADLSALAWAQR
jgi:hypothetical protein